MFLVLFGLAVAVAGNFNINKVSPNVDDLDGSLKSLTNGRRAQLDQVYKAWEFKLDELLSHTQRLEIPNVALKILGSENRNTQQIDVHRNTALLWSVLHNFDSLAQSLIDNNADISIANNQGKTVLDACIDKHNIPILKSIIAKIKKDKDCSGVTFGTRLAQDGLIRKRLVEAAQQDNREVRDVLWEYTKDLELIDRLTIDHKIIGYNLSSDHFQNLAHSACWPNLLLQMPFALKDNIVSIAMYHEDHSFVKDVLDNNGQQLSQDIINVCLYRALSGRCDQHKEKLLRLLGSNKPRLPLICKSCSGIHYMEWSPGNLPVDNTRLCSIQ